MSSSQGSGCCISSGDIAVMTWPRTPVWCGAGGRDGSPGCCWVGGHGRCTFDAGGTWGDPCACVRAWCPGLALFAAGLWSPGCSLGSELGPGRVLVLQQLFFILRQSILLMKQPVSHSQLCLAL